MNFRSFVFLLTLISFSAICAQEFNDIDFQIAIGDATAQRQPVIDNNGHNAALIKVYVDDDIIEVNGGQVGDEIKSIGLQKMLYVAHDTKKLEIIFARHFPLVINFNDFIIPSLTGGMTYILKLKEKGPQPTSITSNNIDNNSSIEVSPSPVNSYNNNVASSSISASENNNIEDENTIAGRIREAYDAKDYSTAFRLAMSIPKNRYAMFYLGRMYECGYGVTIDYNEALKWYEKAAEAGDSEAMYFIGMMYENEMINPHNGEISILRDYKKAMKWFEKAAKLGNNNAMLLIGVNYENGFGVKQDYKKALKWYEMAADGGNDTAMAFIGLLYEKGDVGPRNLNEAFKWFQKAAELGNVDAMTYLGDLYSSFKKNDTEAIKWLKKAADLGNKEAMYRLGWIYEYGNGVTNYTEAINWYKKAAEKGNEFAMHHLAGMYEEGKGVERDYSEAYKWYILAENYGWMTNLDGKLNELMKLIKEEQGK